MLEATPENLQTLSKCLESTLSSETTTRKQAETYINDMYRQPGFALLLLKFLDVEQAPVELRLAAAIQFKNLVKFHWVVPHDEPPAIGDRDRETIKGHLVTLMVKAHPRIQPQLSEALTIIGRHDFPDRWQALLPELVSKLGMQPLDYNIINGVLQTAHSIFQRYRHEYRSDKLWTEIGLVLKSFQEPFLALLHTISGLVDTNAQSAETLRLLFDALTTMTRIFYSLNAQDLPAFFEEHMNEFMTIFHKFLTYQNALLHSSDDDVAGPIDILQAEICEALNLYMEKYEEEFGTYLPTFVDAIWTLLMQKGLEERNDLLVTTAVRFLTSVSKSVAFTLFKEETILRSICEKIVIPNVMIRTSDEETFEDNPIEYIRRDVEGSDNDTRRRSACELVKGLCKNFELQVTQIFSSYITAMLAQYAGNPTEQWRSKDGALYIVSALTAKTGTHTLGATTTNKMINVVDFFSSHVLPELQAQTMNDLPVVKADCIKFISMFRNQLPKEAYGTLLPLLVNFLNAEPFVLYTYTASCIERILTMKEGPALRLSKDELAPLYEPLLTGLFRILERPASRENDYVMKAIMRLCATGQEKMGRFGEYIIKSLTGILAAVAQNPSNPGFLHYVFETLGCVIRYVCPNDPKSIEMVENLLFPAFQTLLSMDVVELAPYIFQILAQMLEIRQPPMSAAYMNVFPPLLNHVLWERQGNVPALVRLLQAYLAKLNQQISEANHLEHVLAIFRKLISSRNTDTHGFYLLQAVVEHCRLEDWIGFLDSVLKILFLILQSRKTIKFIRPFLVFLSLLIAKHGPQILFEKVDSIQSGLMGNIFESIWLPNIQKVAGGPEHKICAVGMTRILCETPVMLSDACLPLWGRLLAALVLFFTAPQDDSVPNEEEEIEIDELPGYSVAFSQLNFASRTEEMDALPQFGDPREHLVVSLHNLMKQHPGILPPVIQNTLEPAIVESLAQLFREKVHPTTAFLV